MTFTPINMVDLTGLSSSAGSTVTGNDVIDHAGQSVSYGDINNDGYDDLIIGAPQANPASGNSQDGAVYVVYGKPGGFGSFDLTNLLPSQGFAIYGRADTGDQFGWSVDGTGDYNSDGKDDLLISSLNNPEGGGYLAGKAYVIFGKTGGYNSFNVSSLTASQGFSVTGAFTNDRLGSSLSSAGDINADGVDDFILYAPNSGGKSIYPGQIDGSRAYVIYGKSSGSTNIDLENLLPSAGFIVSGMSENLTHNVGGVSSAGDFNGDGIDDIVIGSPSWGDVYGNFEGRVFVLFGKVGGLSNIDLSSGIPSGAGVAISGDGIVGSNWTYFGNDVHGGRDVNGDGISDLIIGAPWVGNQNSNERPGAVYVVFGKAGASGTINANALGPTQGYVITGAAAGDHIGASVSFVGDFNGDGVEDMLLGTGPAVINLTGTGLTTESSGGTNAGAAYLIYGKKAGANINLASLTAKDGFKIQGDAAGDFAGLAVSGAGDLNDDGFADLVVGAPLADDPTAPFGGTDAGKAYVIYGRFTGNIQPTAQNDIAAAVEDTPTTYSAASLLGNDTDPDGNSLTISKVIAVTGGTPVLNANGSVTFTPSLNFNGVATFSYVADDGNSGNTIGTVNVNVSAVNDNPVAGADGLRTFVNFPATFQPSQFLYNDKDVDIATNGQSLHIQSVTSGTGGTVALNPNGTVTFTPASNFSGTATFTYVVSDGQGGMGTGNVKVSVNPEGVVPPIETATINAPDGLIIKGYLPFGATGAAQTVSGAGDVNGDGLEDILVTVPGSTWYGDGATYLIYGKAGLTHIDLSAFSPADGVAISGTAVHGSPFPVSAVSAGDINNDGFADILVKAEFGWTGVGKVFVVFGKDNLANIHLSSFSSSDGFTLSGNNYYGYFGSSIASAGDINNDGFDDIVVGAHGYSAQLPDPSPSPGYAYVFLGKANGFSNIDVSVSSASFKITGAAVGDRLGTSVASAGDINKDGYADIVVGAENADGKGAAYVLFGKASGFSDINLGSLSASAGFKIVGGATGDSFGHSVSSAGDINGDGYADIIVGAPTAPKIANGYQGKAYVIFGKAGGFGTVDLTTLNGSNGFSVSYAQIGANVGKSVSSAGDFNGDGFDDLIVGAPGKYNANSPSGSAFVVFGKASGFGANVDTFTMANTAGFEIKGAAIYDETGKSVSGLGDVNGDGYDDLIVGASGSDLGGANAGAAYIIFGRGVDLSNVAPVVGNDSLNVSEDTPATLSVAALLGNDTDADGNFLTITAFNGPAVLNGNGTFTYTPVANFNGTTSFTYTVSDGTVSVNGQVTVNVASVADNPLAGDDVLTVSDPGTYNYNFSTFLINDSDPDGTSLTITGVTSGTGGVATINLGTSTISFTPADGFFGAASFTYTVADSNGGSSTGHVTVNVTDSNNAPVAEDDQLTASKDKTTVFAASQIVGNDSDADMDPLVIASVTSGDHGTVILNVDGTVEFEPEAGFVGSASFTYVVSDGQGKTDSGTVTVEVVPAVDALDDVVAATEDTAVTIVIDDLLQNDVPSPGNTVSLYDYTTVTNGTLFNNGDGTLTFTPDPNFSGDAVFTYTASDGMTTDTATVTINVASVLDVVNAVNNTLPGIEDFAKTIAPSVLLGNDSGEGTLTVQSVSNPTNGSVTINGDGNIVFTPTANFHGAATFDYVLAADNGTDTATVTINFLSVQDPPVAGADQLDAVKDTELVIDTATLLANDSQGDGGSLYIEDLFVASGGGSVVFDYANTITFTPDPGYIGLVQIIYYLSNGDDFTDGTLTINVLDPNAPAFDLNGAAAGEDNSATYSIGSDGAILAPSLLLTDADDTMIQGVEIKIASGLLPGDVLAIQGASGGIIGVGPAIVFLDYDYDAPSGTLTIIGEASVGSYQALLRTIQFSTTASAPGTARTIEWRAADDTSLGQPQTTTLALTENATPTAAGNNSVTTDEGTASSAVSVNAADTDGDTLTYSVKSGAGPAKGNVAFDQDAGTFTYTPTGDNYGSDSFTILISDGKGGTAEQVVSVTINPVDDPLQNNLPGTQTVGEDGTKVFNAANSNLISITDVDDEAGPITVTLSVLNGVLTLSGTGGLTFSDGDGLSNSTMTFSGTAVDINAALNGLSYTPGSNYAGGDTLTVTSKDSGANLSETSGTVDITVTPVDDPAVGKNDSVATAENAILNGNLFDDNGLGIDEDTDGPALEIAEVNGQSGNVGSTITLASGAKLTVNSDGTFSYDPNGKFNHLISSAKATATGAVNDGQTESFTYKLTGGNTVTVVVNVTGVDGSGDQLWGNSVDNILTGTSQGDFFRLDQGGDDSASGGSGSDGFYFGGALTSGDSPDGGADRDYVTLAGDYWTTPLTLGAGFKNIELITLLSGADTQLGLPGGQLFDYHIVTDDANATAAGGVVVVDAGQLLADEDFTFDASAEKDG
ncbi:MAG TPA: tandem-95 repeat protein, partial [Allosphingosinicella sp.]